MSRPIDVGELYVVMEVDGREVLRRATKDDVDAWLQDSRTFDLSDRRYISVDLNDMRRLKALLDDMAKPVTVFDGLKKLNGG